MKSEEIIFRTLISCLSLPFAFKFVDLLKKCLHNDFFSLSGSFYLTWKICAVVVVSQKRHLGSLETTIKVELPNPILRMRAIQFWRAYLDCSKLLNGPQFNTVKLGYNDRGYIKFNFIRAKIPVYFCHMKFHVLSNSYWRSLESRYNQV